jgi:hypothetical protein
LIQGSKAATSSFLEREGDTAEVIVRKPTNGIVKYVVSEIFRNIKKKTCKFTLKNATSRYIKLTAQ